MDMPSEPNDLQVDPTLYSSPLKVLAIEVNELYQELQSVGFPEKALNQIIAHLLADSLLYREEVYEPDEEDDENDEDEDEIEDDTEDGLNI